MFRYKTIQTHALEILTQIILVKVNSVQEACEKCFAVHVLKFEILQITQKKNNQRTSDS